MHVLLIKTKNVSGFHYAIFCPSSNFIILLVVLNFIQQRIHVYINIVMQCKDATMLKSHLIIHTRPLSMHTYNELLGSKRGRNIVSRWQTYSVRHLKIILLL